MPDLTAESLPKKRPPRAAYALPTLFTAGNIFLGYLCILRTIQGALLYASSPAQAALDFEVAAKTIGFAVLLDGLDGRIARMTNTTSEFGRELDSLADVISFGIAPAILAYVWGVLFVGNSAPGGMVDQFSAPGSSWRSCFWRAERCGWRGLISRRIRCRAIRGCRPEILRGAGDSTGGGHGGGGCVRLRQFSDHKLLLVGAWLALLALLSFLMVSTWRYWSFKELNMLRPRSPVLLVLMCGTIYAIWNWSQPVLLILASTYVGERGFDPHRRDYPAVFRGNTRRHAGGSGWLTQSHWWAAKHCWAGMWSRSSANRRWASSCGWWRRKRKRPAS